MTQTHHNDGPSSFFNIIYYPFINIFGVIWIALFYEFECHLIFHSHFTSTSRSFPRSWRITGFVTREIRRGATCGAETSYSSADSGPSEFIAFIVVYPLVPFHLAIVLSVLLSFTDVDYPFGIFILLFEGREEGIFYWECTSVTSCKRYFHWDNILSPFLCSHLYLCINLVMVIKSLFLDHESQIF